MRPERSRFLWLVGGLCLLGASLRCSSSSSGGGACGNGKLDPGEGCDWGIVKGQLGACPDFDDCKDRDACTFDDVQGGGTCQAICTHRAMPGCTMCGDAILQQGEFCDTAFTAGTPGACPTSCDDRIACTADTKTGTDCQTQCTYALVTQARLDMRDSCCPSGATRATDLDCSATCGNGVVEPGETCDTAATGAGRCPTSSTCGDANPCTIDGIVSEGTCNALCTHQPITQVGPADGCCPPGGNAVNDPADCMPACGNGVVETGELCDTAITSGIGTCPNMAACNDADPCTIDAVASPGTCNAHCTHTPITAIGPADGCCPSGGNMNNEPADCNAICGNGVLEAGGGEKCDTTIAMGQAGFCPRPAQAATDCNDSNACTTESVTGVMCQAQCAHTSITACVSGDSCCPGTCNRPMDLDCPPTCADTLKDGNETDVDCGGPNSCQRCATGDSCAVPGDCASGLCATTCQPPAMPTITSTVPGSPSKNLMPGVKGTATGTSVKIFSGMCGGTLVGMGTPADFADVNGIQVVVPDNATTTLFAQVTDARGDPSGCSAGFAYSADNTAPTFAGATLATGGTLSVTVDWLVATDMPALPFFPLSYEVCFSTTAGTCLTTFTAMQTVTDVSMAMPATSATISGLTAATQYFVVVHAVDAAGNHETANMAEVNATTAP